MEETKVRRPRHSLVDATRRPLAELLTAAPDSALAQVLRLVREHELKQSERQTICPFSSAL